MQKLTIVIPSYNEQEVLKDTVPRLWSIEREVVTQNFLSEDSDILIVDDGSSDNTWSIIESFHK
ncbi:glycosyltransferase [Lacticaseibacillus paracasei]|nr:glycosyltransferase [Lacticaseibacillus paracasei]